MTNSGSVLRTLGAGVAVVVPDLNELADLPASAVIRYDHVQGLADALRAVTNLTDDTLRAMSRAARDFVRDRSWAAAWGRDNQRGVHSRSQRTPSSSR